MTLYLYNTLHRKKEKFVPLQEGLVGIYVCGPTVYNHCHIGHGKSYITFDVLVRYLRKIGYKVRYVQNITDVGHLTEDTDEDKILKQSRLENLEPMEMVERYTRSYFEDMDALNVLRPDISPRASAHVPEQIELIERLLEKGYAYEANGSVYFAIEKFADYGKLSGRKREDQMEGARVGVDPDKKDPRDFLLWRKASEEHILKWKSPWGLGYPGWHLECSAMSMRYIGETLDIHGGGMENQFPHHESEIAQSECANDKLFVNFWIHHNMVTVDGQKMGKSLGNFITLKDAFKKHDPLVIRFAILRTHYRSPMDYSEEALHAAKSGFDRLKTVYEALKRIKSEPASKDRALGEMVDRAQEAFQTAMDDDLNTPRALAAAFDLTGEINGLLASDAAVSAADLDQALDFFENSLGNVLGIDLSAGQGNAENLEARLVELLIELRKSFRGEKLWAQADQVRDGLTDLGITLKDSKDGTLWKKD